MAEDGAVSADVATGVNPIDAAETQVESTMTPEEDEKRRLRKQQKLEMKLAARARSKEKRKQNKVEKTKQVREEKQKLEAEVLKNSAADSSSSSAASTFDADRDAMIKQLSEIREDKSRAGRVDEQILPFVDTINSFKDIYTTSSCAGRTIIACSFRDATKNKKFNIAWVYITHEMADATAAFDSVEKFLAESKTASESSTADSSIKSVEDSDDESKVDAEDDKGDEIWFKMEPVIVAIRIRSIAAARNFLNLARTNGFKNSGIRSIGADGTVMLTIVDTFKIEALVAKDSKLLITADYMQYLVESANRKLLASRKRLEAFRQLLEQRQNVV